jgi:DNA-binding phage protein
MKTIGREIRRIIKKKGISLYQIAKDLGVTWESLYRSLLNGANPEWKRIGQILDYLDYDFVLKPKRKEVKPRKTKPPKSKRRKGEL